MIIIAYGANLPSHLGSPSETYHALPEILAKSGIHVDRASSLYETAPVPVSDQPNYMNAVMRVHTDLTPDALMSALMDVEAALGRIRHHANEARGIDLDLIAYHDEVTSHEHVTLPHPRMHQRRFVLDPLLEIAPDWVHPVSGKLVSELISSLTQQNIAA